MPLADDSLSAQYAGKVVAIEKLKSLGWTSQCGPKPRRFLPRRDRLWSMEFAPAFDSCEPIKLYVLLQLTPDGCVSTVETCVARVLKNGHRDEMRLPLRYPDDETAKRLIRDALADSAKDELAERSTRASTTPLCLPSLVQLIGRPDTCEVAQLLAERFSLRRSPTMFASGNSWTCEGSRLEFQTDDNGHITTVFLSTIADDHLCKEVKATVGRDAVRHEFGTPTRTAEDGSWDRFDGNVALHVSYSADRAVTTKLTIMARHTAP
jgi:hypothetical protein